jgi:hypothetical protein
LALQQVVGYLRYTGRDANVVARAAQPIGAGNAEVEFGEAAQQGEVRFAQSTMPS